MLPAEASEHLGEAQGGDGPMPLSICGSPWCEGGVSVLRNALSWPS